MFCFNFSGRDLPAIEGCRIGININNATATKADNIEWTGYRKVESKLRSEVNTKNAKQHRLVRGWTGYRKVESKEDTSNNCFREARTMNRTKHQVGQDEIMLHNNKMTRHYVPPTGQ